MRAQSVMTLAFAFAHRPACQKFLASSQVIILHTWKNTGFLEL